MVKRISVFAKLALITTPFFIAPSLHAENFITGNDLDRSCATTRGQCTAYVVGVVDMIAMQSSIGRGICIPAEATGSQVTDVVAAWLKTNAKDRHQNAAGLVWRAIKEAWPCQQ